MGSDNFGFGAVRWMTATLMAAIPAIMAPRMIGFLHGFPVVIEKFLAVRQLER